MMEYDHLNYYQENILNKKDYLKQFKNNYATNKKYKCLRFPIDSGNLPHT